MPLWDIIETPMKKKSVYHIKIVAFLTSKKVGTIKIVNAKNHLFDRILYF